MMKKSNQLNIVLFCGGRGCATIIQELLRWPHISLTLIVNAYDDGLSTGVLRDYIAEMLGPSDFRKNLSYLLDPYSNEQYALKALLEYRLKTGLNDDVLQALKALVENKMPHEDLKEVRDLILRLEPKVKMKILTWLSVFLKYAENADKRLDYSDFSLGNLIFAGSYLANNKNFNQAAQQLAQLVNSRAALFNVSEGENRILVALKENGDILFNEASVVSSQSSSKIKYLFLLKKALTKAEEKSLVDKNFAEKRAYLNALTSIPALSIEAADAIKQADVIIYGPGTQHSSLFPSYLIAGDAIKACKDANKIFIMNLEKDYDITAFNSVDVIDAALFYLNDVHNEKEVITHLFFDEGSAAFSPQDLHYKNMVVIKKPFANITNLKVHNGHAVVKEILALKDIKKEINAVQIFVNIHKRSLASHALIEEFLETPFASLNLKTELFIYSDERMPHHYQGVHYLPRTEKNFPEIKYFFKWLMSGKSDYLVTLTGDGEYRFRDVLMGISLLNQSDFGVLLGSRTQSRRQFMSSITSAYGEKKILRIMSVCGAFLLSGLFFLRFQIIFSDPLTGFRIYKRQKISLLNKIRADKVKTPITLIKCILKNKIEIAELPVHYKTFSGFTDPYWRLRLGIKNLLRMFV